MPGQLSEATERLLHFLFASVERKVPDRAMVSSLCTLGRDESVALSTFWADHGQTIILTSCAPRRIVPAFPLRHGP